MNAGLPLIVLTFLVGGCVTERTAVVAEETPMNQLHALTLLKITSTMPF
jgi:hypothetical protein